MRRFQEGATVEGLALSGEGVWYAHDDETIRLSVASARDRTGSPGAEARERRT